VALETDQLTGIDVSPLSVLLVRARGKSDLNAETAESAE
jgi:hypothetical protein